MTSHRSSLSLKFFLIALAWLVTTSCSTPANAPSETPSVSPPSKRTQRTERCLNIIDGETRIEFTGRTLKITPTADAMSVEMELDQGSPVTCTHLQLVEGAKLSTVMIRFTTLEEGTSVGVSDERVGFLTTQAPRWAMNPVTLVRHFNSASGAETSERATMERSDRNGRVVFTLTDIASKTKKTFAP